MNNKAAESNEAGTQARGSELVAGMLLAGISTIFVLGVLELGMRVTFNGEGPTRILDSELGWRTKADLDLTRERHVFGEVHYTTARNGFRSWGDLNAETRVMVIGDSYTQGAQVSDGNTFYDLSSCAGVGVFAYGTGGYGTLQEYMILDRYVDEIRPTVLVWQFSPNDVINNHWELESRSLFNNNRMVRPYREAGRIDMRYPSRNFWMRHTMLGRWVASRPVWVSSGRTD